MSKIWIFVKFRAHALERILILQIFLQICSMIPGRYPHLRTILRYNSYKLAPNFFMIAKISSYKVQNGNEPLPSIRVIWIWFQNLLPFRFLVYIFESVLLEALQVSYIIPAILMINELLEVLLYKENHTQGYSHLSGMEMTSLLNKWFHSNPAFRPSNLSLGGGGCEGSPFSHESTM